MTEQKVPKGLAVYIENEKERERGKALAAHLQVPLLQEGPETEELVLFLGEEGLSLRGKGQELRGDFSRMLPRLRKANLQGEMLVKAAKLKGFEGTPTAIDATAGMGEDALLLAASGFQVQLFEQDPVIAALLQDTLIRAAAVPELAEIVARMTFVEGDSVEALKKLGTPPDVVVLDPMFPARKKSGLIKKKFQLLQELERPCGNEEELLEAAVVADPRKIVIKRPLKGPYLAERKPSYSLPGKAIRYDCIVFVRE